MKMQRATVAGVFCQESLLQLLASALEFRKREREREGGRERERAGERGRERERGKKQGRPTENEASDCGSRVLP